MSDYSKLNYFLISLKNFLQKKGLECPSCNSKDNETVDKKYIITSLKRCKTCMLLYRTPRTNIEENKKFYNKKYAEGFTTDCPNDEKLNELISNNFKNTEKDYSKYIEILDILNLKINRSSPTLFDYGCSWGYGSYQLKEKFNVDSYEISYLRAKYARDKLKINVLEESELNSLSRNKKYDIFFMSHVLEHVPNPPETLNFGLKLLKMNGFLISFTPNGSMEHKKTNSNWSKLWGMVHGNLIDEIFYQKFFSENIFYIGSCDYHLKGEYNFKNIKNFINSNQNYIDNLSGNELMIIVKKIKDN
jgi:2-polyprenyl-3-methyl-5-hydroxy-6-metoxy-1,4-benzoquinol methylase